MTSADVLAHRRPSPKFGYTAFGGTCLGVAAFAVDFVSESVARFIVPIASSGSGWGAAALMVALAAHSRRPALRGIVFLTTATLAYYTLILVVSQRWYHPDGGSGPSNGSASLVRSLACWLLGSLCGGVTMGFLADRIRLARPNL
jgi:hypothetical protein